MADPISIVDQALAAYRGTPVPMGTGGLFQYVYPGSGDTEYLVKAGLPVMDAINLIGPGTPRRPTSGITQPLPPSLIDALNQNALTPDPRPPLTPTPGQYIAGVSPAPGLIPGGTQTQFPITPGATPPPSVFAAIHGTPFGTPGQSGFNPGPIDPTSGTPLGTVTGYPSPLPGYTPPWGTPSVNRPTPRPTGPPMPVGSGGGGSGPSSRLLYEPTTATGRHQSSPFSLIARRSSSGPGGK